MKNSEIGIQGLLVSGNSGYKRVYDVIVLTLAHLLLFPLWLVVWLVIPALIYLEDRGPIFYQQKRTGKGGKVFTILKFRTMIPNAESLGPSWNVEKDPRVTRIGAILRRTGLDELPEVLSIFKGDMSLVGPRPLPQQEQESLEQKILGFAQRLEVTPGLTGMAQIYDEHDDARVKLNYDLEYIARMSPWLDTKLLLLSVPVTLVGRWDRRRGKSEPPQSSDTH